MNFTVDEWAGKPRNLQSPSDGSCQTLALPGRLDLVLLRDYCNELVNSVDFCFMICFIEGLLTIHILSRYNQLENDK